MSVEKNRLASLIEFAKQSAKMRTAPPATVRGRGQFALFEHDAQGLPGIHLNPQAGDDEIWLRVDRLHESKRPEVTSTVLRPWVEGGQSPETEPRLKDSVDGAALIAAGTHRSAPKQLLDQTEAELPPVHPNKIQQLEEYEKKGAVKNQFKIYLENAWRPWAANEKRRRRTIRLYAQLFTLKQKMDGGIVEAEIELAWGVGLGLWCLDGHSIDYPLLTRLAEISVDPDSAAIEVRPRDQDPRLEVDWYVATSNPGVAKLEVASREFFGKTTTTFSPFDRGTFEPLLRACAAHLDANGVFWPDHVDPSDRRVPEADDKLKVTDTWVLFERPRTNSVFIQDLDKLKAAVGRVDEDPAALPAAVLALVSEPATENSDIQLPAFRGISGCSTASLSSGNTKAQAQDLFFPKPFNDEQVRIVQMLEVSDGVVVQGPPGTGKTHTIANVICHYLANGQRVLVTSMKDPALAVLRDQLPEEIRPLAISLLASEQEGMKQFEHAIQKIASEIQGLDRVSTARAIAVLEQNIDGLHGRLLRIDREVGEWARRNLERVTIGDESIEPLEAAKEVVDSADQLNWPPDRLGIALEYEPRFKDADVVSLRDARRVLGKDIDYLGCVLPQMAAFPDLRLLLQVHQDLSHLALLNRKLESGEVPALVDSSEKAAVAVAELTAKVQEVKDLREQIALSGCAWTDHMRDQLRLGSSAELITMLTSLGTELESCVEKRRTFVARPVTVPPGSERDIEFIEAVDNLAEGRSAFGFRGWLGKSQAKMKLGEVRVLGAPPNDSVAWQHVREYLGLQSRLCELAIRWNALAVELGIGTVDGSEPSHGLESAREFVSFRSIQVLVGLELDLRRRALWLFPSWTRADDVIDSTEAFEILDKALAHHSTRSRLSLVWATREQFQNALAGCTGRVVSEIRTFFNDVLGNPAVEDSRMQATWSKLLDELRRVQGLSQHLKSVEIVAALVEDSGAVALAAQLRRQPCETTNDGILPDDWRRRWRLRRLATHLEAIDAQDELARLSKARSEIETELARCYRDVVAKRTWCKLAEKASPRIRSALQAYLNAIQKIGKGTGKRAVRYRQDARAAASQANPAVPCWIMSHHRVSESLPPELGCFDLVVVDEASQSDLTALPALLRAKKVLVVGDDKQVSPEAIGLAEDQARSLMERFLSEQISSFRPLMSPERSIYDLYRVVFAGSGVMLKEHFRSVGPVIEYSKREFYNHELRPLRVPRSSERLDPPLVDVLVEHGFRGGDTNQPEVDFIVGEVKKIVADPTLAKRSIGVVSLLGAEQALRVWEKLTDEIGTEEVERHRIRCGDARTFQGNERDIMFLSMVAAPNDVGAPLSRDTFAQRFNVAASRARDRMYLVRSLELSDLSPADRLRRSLIEHFSCPFAQNEERVDELRQLCESPFEREVFDELSRRGYRVVPQVKVGQYRIDMVVEGHDDARLAIECDGDRYHGPEKWADDMQRQRVLERAGWTFWRSFASAFVRRRQDVVDDLIRTLTDRGIAPIGRDGAQRSIHTELRRVSPPDLPTDPGADVERKGFPSASLRRNFVEN
jgi:very-short-patch-repair endonuclease